MSKKPLVSLTAKNFRWDYYNGSGKGGQNRNKRANCVRCFHDPSGSMGKSEDERDLGQNKKLAFKRCTEKETFKKWLKIESMRVAGQFDHVEETVNRQMEEIKVEGKDEEGRWSELPKS